MVSEDWELRVSRDRSLSASGKLVHDVIKRTSHIVDAIADEKGPVVRRATHPLNVVDVVPVIGDDVEGVRLLRREGIEFRVKRVEMFLRPIETAYDFK
ncbi:MAG: hypothetical protein WEA75_11030 [Acidimicrobiia bacterium]